MKEPPVQRSRREALRVIAAAVCSPLLGSVLPGCGGGGNTLKALRLKEDRQVQVLLVPGFMSELYECFSRNAADFLSNEILSRIRALNEDLHAHFPNAFFGDRFAALLEPVELVAENALITFDAQQKQFAGQGIDFTNIASPENKAKYGFNPLEGVAHNATAIAGFLRDTERAEEKSVIIVSHSKGGLDTLDALLQYPSLWETTVAGWLSLQAPFHGSPVADPYTLAPEIGDVLFEVLGGEGDVLGDLTLNARALYMNHNQDAIAELTNALPVISAYSSYTDGQPLEESARAVAELVVDDDLAGRVLDIVLGHAFPAKGGPPRPLAAVIARSAVDVFPIITDELEDALAQTIPNIGLLDETNMRMRRFLGERNDGFVTVASTMLPGAESIELSPDCDHAAPVMTVAPFRDYWTEEQRNDATRDGIGRVQETETAS